MISFAGQLGLARVSAESRASRGVVQLEALVHYRKHVTEHSRDHVSAGHARSATERSCPTTFARQVQDRKHCATVCGLACLNDLLYAPQLEESELTEAAQSGYPRRFAPLAVTEWLRAAPGGQSLGRGGM